MSITPTFEPPRSGVGTSKPEYRVGFKLNLLPIELYPAHNYSGVHLLQMLLETRFRSEGILLEMGVTGELNKAVGVAVVSDLGRSLTILKEMLGRLCPWPFCFQIGYVTSELVWQVVHPEPLAVREFIPLHTIAAAERERAECEAKSRKTLDQIAKHLAKGNEQSPEQ
jgi:hypothetical protein